VRRRAFYSLDDLVLELDSEQSQRDEIGGLLEQLCWARMPSPALHPDLHLRIAGSNGTARIPEHGHELFRADGFLGCEIGNEFYLTDGSSVLHVRPTIHAACARLASSFYGKPPLSRSNFWCFGLLKLLRSVGVYSLHAAALITPNGAGLLLVGPPESGKSTLTIGLIREGWKFLSDDALLLRAGSHHIEALACRKSFYIDAVRSHDYSDFLLGSETPDSQGRQRRNLVIDERFAGQYTTRCIPRIVIFPRVQSQDISTLTSIGGARALGILLSQSAPQLFDRSSTTAQLAVLKRLLGQTEAYELAAGLDLYHEPEKLIQFICQARGEDIVAACN
jgi:hypothetical protein